MWWIPLIASLLAAGGSLAGTLISNKKTREYNRELAEYQNQENLAQWARENEYNTPLAQMQRYQNAGLNPNLIYGQQNLSNNSPMLTSGQPGSPVDFAPFGQMGAGAAQSAFDQSLQQENIAHQNDLLQSQSDYYQSLTEGQNTDNKKKALDLSFDEQTFGDRVAQLRKQTDIFNEQVNEIVARIRNMNSDSLLKEIESKFSDRLFSSQLCKIGAEIKKLTADTAYSQSLKQFTDVQAGRAAVLLPLEVANLKAETKLKAYQMVGLKYGAVESFLSAERQAFGLQYDKDNKLYFDLLNALPFGLNHLYGAAGLIRQAAYQPPK